MERENDIDDIHKFHRQRPHRHRQPPCRARGMREALKSYAADSFDSATSLADHDFMGYGATAHAALAWEPEK